MSNPILDVFVIGAGQAAYPLLDGLAERGMKLGLAERKQFGGSCVNFGCTPSKAVIESGRVAHMARRGKEFGIEIGHVKPHFSQVMAQAREIVGQSVAGLTEAYGSMKGLRVFRAQAKFLGRVEHGYELLVGDERVVAANVVIDTGSRSLIPNVTGLGSVSYMDSENWIDHSGLPSRMAILGGGYIAVELGQFYRRMGSEVTILEQGPRLLAHEDDDVSDAIKNVLEQESIRILLNSHVSSVARDPGGITVSWNAGQWVGDGLLVATGRIANTDDLGLDTIDVQVDKHGIIEVDEHLRTSAPGVFAVGDVRGGGMFTSTAWDDGRIVLGVLTGNPRRTTDRVVPYAVFIDPELGRVGLTEREAADQGKNFKVCRYDVAHNGRNNQARERTGFVKVLVETDTDHILGATVFGAAAAETSQIFSVLMAAKAPASVFRDTVATHPTYVEALQSALL